jgi:hypothetical protein
MSPPRPKSAGRRLRTPLRRRHGVHYSPRAPRTALMLVDRRPRPMAVVVPSFRAQGILKQGCHADVFRRTDGRSDDGRGGVRDLDAL